jgi:2-keto-4-pentenoate hydratase
VLSAVDYVPPCPEIVDSRICDWDISIVDTVADNASSARFCSSSGEEKVVGGPEDVIVDVALDIASRNDGA